MMEGIPFRGRNVDPSPSAHGAHDLSINESQVPDFSHYDNNGLAEPNINVNPSLSNVDDVVNEIKTMIGL